MTRDGSGGGHVVLVFGSTGTAGNGAIRASLADPAVSEVRAVTRRPLAVTHAKRTREVQVPVTTCVRGAVSAPVRVVLLAD